MSRYLSQVILERNGDGMLVPREQPAPQKL